MTTRSSGGMKIAWILLPLFLCIICSRVEICFGQDYDVDEKPAAPPPEQDDCNGVFLTYTFTSREKLYPHVKNVSAQAWGFKSEASILNAGDTEIKAWKMFIGFQHREILVSATNAVVVDGDDLPAAVGNGTTLAGNPMTDLKTSIETAGDFNQIQVRMEFSGTQFGLKPSATPMPKTIRLENDGFKCPAPRIRGKTYMHVCCKKDPKYKVKKPIKTKFFPRQNGDLSLTYDILQAYTNNYQAQVTIDNNHQLGRLDHWNLTWEWMRGEFIYNMRGAYTHKKDPSECIYGPAGKYYQDFDFSKVMNCAKKPIIADLPPDRAEDKDVGKLPYCCKNGTILPKLMDESKARSIFQLQVYKLPPDLNRTALNPPMRWKINGVLNPEYRCSPPIRVDPTEFPDPSGLDTTTSAIASWQIICNITRPKPKAARCCVSFSAFYNDSVIPCNTCACGCPDTNNKCNANAHPMLLPAEALLVPFANRTEKAKAYARLNHFPIPRKLPCPDNCPVSINWHITTDQKTGWTARITLFNWEEFNFENWFTALQFKKASRGYENVYSFNGTMLPELNRTIFMQGLKGLNYLMGETNGTHTYDPRVPGKQQSVISFTKKNMKDFKIQRDGFPSKVFFNGEECALPTTLPRVSSGHKSRLSSMAVIFIAILTFMLMADHLI